MKIVSGRRLSPLRCDAGVRNLLVPQGFDGIQPGGLDSGQHPAHNSYEAEDHRRCDQRSGVNHEVDVSLAGIVDEGAPQRE